jgi:hypothetical protein
VDIRRSKFNLQPTAVSMSDHGLHHLVNRHTYSLRGLRDLLPSPQDAIGIFLGE